jgi:putative metallohydrolase (TIGR04338 family)
VRDGQRQRLYDAEDLVRRQLELAAAGARAVVVAHSTLTLPLEVRFGSLEAVQRYADAVVATAAFGQRFPAAAAAPLRVRAGRGNRHAFYEAPGTIVLHDASTRSAWSLREVVVLHELAHHVAHHDLAPEPAHGGGYAGVLMRLVTDVMGAEVGLLLTAAFADHDVAWVPVP